jgi:hypothetical protein
VAWAFFVACCSRLGYAKNVSPGTLNVPETVNMHAPSDDRSRLTPAGQFTAEHLKALDYLKEKRAAVADGPEEERILADLAAAGFAKKEGNAYIYAGNASATAPMPSLARDAGRWLKSITLSPIQNMILWAGVACIGLLLLFVPWTTSTGYPEGYGFLLAPPTKHAARIDLIRLVLPMILVAGVTGAAVYLAGKFPRHWAKFLAMLRHLDMNSKGQQGPDQQNPKQSSQLKQPDQPEPTAPRPTAEGDKTELIEYLPEAAPNPTSGPAPEKSSQPSAAVQSAELFNSVAAPPLQPAIGTKICHRCGCALQLTSGDGASALKCPGCSRLFDFQVESDPIPTASAAVAHSGRSAGPAGIGGWLILPAIGLVFGPFGTIVGIATASIYVGLLEKEYPGFRQAVAIQTALDVLFLSFQIFVAITFFQRRQVTPALMICLYAASFILVFAGELQSATALRTSPDPMPIIKSAVIGAIWIAYFLVSKRVKATFTSEGLPLQFSTLRIIFLLELPAVWFLAEHLAKKPETDKQAEAPPPSKVVTPDNFREQLFAPPSKPAPKPIPLTAENWDKLRPGMLRTEIENILGKPHQEQGSDWFFEGRVLKWGDDSKNIEIILTNDNKAGLITQKAILALQGESLSARVDWIKSRLRPGLIKRDEVEEIMGGHPDKFERVNPYSYVVEFDKKTGPSPCVMRYFPFNVLSVGADGKPSSQTRYRVNLLFKEWNRVEGRGQVIAWHYDSP